MDTQLVVVADGQFMINGVFEIALDVDVRFLTLEDAAYSNKDGDARQLWVKMNDKVAFVIACGDVAKEEGSRAIAEILIEAFQ